jgi:hypothetical protein
MRQRLQLAAILVAAAVALPARAEDTYSSWEVLKNPFPSTGGGGVMIDGYDPQIVGATCVTPFRALMPDGAIYANTIEFDAVPAQGGTLCTNGRWRSADGSASGTTTFRVFIKDGIVRRSP